MIAPLVLLVFVALASTAGRDLLSRASWVTAAPRGAIWAWQSLSLAIASAVLLAAVTLAVPLLPIRSGLAQLARITPLELDAHYETPGGPWIAGAALVFAVVLLGRILMLSALSIHRSARLRREQVATLDLVGTDHPDGFIVVDHDAALVYCLPGRRTRVVVTSSALALLSHQELRLVLAHERTHLRARHDLALAVSAALARTFAPLPIFAHAHEQITALVEMQADDAAHLAADRRALARALVTLSVGGHAHPAGAGSSANALARVRRLTGPTSLPLGLRHAAAVGMTTSLLIAAPVALALAPAIEASALDCCEARL